jgi:hypothetical protein
VLLNKLDCISEVDEFETSLIEPISKNSESVQYFLKDYAIAIAKRQGSLDEFKFVARRRQQQKSILLEHE